MVISTGYLINFENALNVCEQVSKQIQLAHAAFDIDCQALTEYDSSILTLLLSWLRLANDLGVRCRFVNVPDRLQAMSKVYGLDTLLPIVK